MASMNDGTRPAARKHPAHHDRPWIKAADEIEAELFRRVPDHHGIGERAAEQIFREPYLLIKFGDRSRGRGRRMGVRRLRYETTRGMRR